MMHRKGISRLVLALVAAGAFAVPFGPPASATPISDQTVADIYKSCYDYCLSGLSEDECRSGCTCEARLAQKQLTLEEATAFVQGTASPDVMARLEAIVEQCNP
jgi:hypothetical protein